MFTVTIPSPEVGQAKGEGGRVRSRIWSNLSQDLFVGFCALTSTTHHQPIHPTSLTCDGKEHALVCILLITPHVNAVFALLLDTAVIRPLAIRAITPGGASGEEGGDDGAQGRRRLQR
jgi:hypothetical protein